MPRSSIIGRVDAIAARSADGRRLKYATADKQALFELMHQLQVLKCEADER